MPCEGSVGYHDRDKDLAREFDILAYRGLTRAVANGASVQFTLKIVGEVKKSEKPWVALRERSVAVDDLLDAWRNLTCGSKAAEGVLAAEEADLGQLRSGFRDAIF